jgi:uncharacterized protein
MLRLILILLAFFVLLGSAGISIALPKCEGSPSQKATYMWDNCVGEERIVGRGIIYSGEFKNGRHHGFGSFTYPNGAKYTGEFESGFWHGKGTLTDANGNVKKGVWKQNKFQDVSKTTATANFQKGLNAYEKRDYATALREWTPLAEQGNAIAQHKLGRMYQYGLGVPQDDKAAVKWYRPAADQGYALAQNNLGFMYQKGHGVPQDDKAAVKWYRLAADQGYAIAQSNLGWMYLGGRGVPQDDKAAVKWYRLAADQGYANAQGNLGKMYANGRGVPQDDKAAVKWYRPAADQGYALAQNNLGWMYHKGRGVRQDETTAVKWYRLAADQGYAIAQSNLGAMYEEGRGVPQDDTTAVKWYRLAADQGNAFGQDNLERLQGKLITKRKPSTTTTAKKLEPKFDHQKRLELAHRTQEALQVLDLYSGKLDGIIGVKTKSAIRRWQERNGFPSTGEVDQDQLAKLEQQGIARLAQKKPEPRVADKKYRHAVAVIIGNKNYRRNTPEVSFAHNDADAFKRHLLNQVGYREGNIIDLRDATQAELIAVFGSEKTHEGKLWSYVRSRKSDVTVFYSGHGVPGLKDRRGYLLPVDADPNLIELNGYPVDLLFENLSKIETKSMAVFLDTCFSGDSPKGMIVRATSGLTVTPRMPKNMGRMVVFTAARGDQFASWDEDAKLGLFTKHLLDALRGAADGSDYGNGDGNVTVGEVHRYLDDEMSYQARRRFNRRQNVSVRGDAATVLTDIRE